MAADPVANEWLADLLAPVRRVKLEERFLEQAIGDLDFAISSMNKYLPWLLRRYRVSDPDAT